MADQQSILAFIRQHRGDESHFTVLHNRLLGDESADDSTLQPLKEEGEKLADVYKNAKEKSGTAWPEFENFVSFYEKSLTSQAN